MSDEDDRTSGADFETLVASIRANGYSPNRPIVSESPSAKVERVLRGPDRYRSMKRLLRECG